MSKYTTGEIAKLCGVTVRTVQYYDTRGILIPTELSEGGRRLYSEDDLKRMKIICFLRDLGLPIDAISQILSEANPSSTISLLLEQQEIDLREELNERQAKLKKLEELKTGLRVLDNVSVQSIGDVAYIMSRKKALRQIHTRMIIMGLPLSLLQWVTIIIWIAFGIWWPFVVWAVSIFPFGALVFKYYYDKVSYICPNCHEVFKPSLKESIFANHTPSTRKLTCTCCGKKSWCVEVASHEADISQ